MISRVQPFGYSPITFFWGLLCKDISELISLALSCFWCNSFLVTVYVTLKGISSNAWYGIHYIVYNNVLFIYNKCFQDLKVINISNINFQQLYNTLPNHGFPSTYGVIASVNLGSSVFTNVLIVSGWQRTTFGNRGPNHCLYTLLYLSAIFLRNGICFSLKPGIWNS